MQPAPIDRITDLSDVQPLPTTDDKVLGYSASAGKPIWQPLPVSNISNGTLAAQTARWDGATWIAASNATNNGATVQIKQADLNTQALTVQAATGAVETSAPCLAIKNAGGSTVAGFGANVGDGVIILNNQTFIRATGGSWQVLNKPIEATLGLKFGDAATLICGGGGGNPMMAIDCRPDAGSSQGPIVLGDITTDLPRSGTSQANHVVELARNTIMRQGTRLFASAPTSAPDDAALGNGRFTFHLDEASNALMIRVRFSDGTYKSGQIALS